MTFFVAWFVFPVVLAVLSYGCGKLIELVAGVELPPALLLPLGWVVISLTTLFAQASDATASLQAPAVVTLAVCGLGFTLSRTRPRVDWWLAGAGAGAFAFFAAPVVLSGRATFAGYIKLDDTATYLAMLDRAMHHGYNVAGLAQSTYELTLRTSLLTAYPLGSLLPLGVGSTLLGQDPAWLWQPYLTFLAGLVALVLYQLVGGLVRRRWLRAVVAAVAAQAALLYGYALWGGIKEIATAVIVGAAVVLVVQLRLVTGARAIVPLAAVSAALPGVLSAGGLVWLAVPLVAALVLAVRTGGAGRAAALAAVFVGETLLLAIPTLIVTKSRLDHSGAFTTSGEYGNLLRPLRWFQSFGIWVNDDFRTAPHHATVTYMLIGLAAAAVGAAIVLAWRLRAWELLVALGTVGLAMVVYVRFGSPWIGGKAIATSSPFVLAAALAGVAALFEAGRRIEAAAIGGLLLAGVLWSNALQYQAAVLAPSNRFSELATIGGKFPGQGPTLLTEFDSYGARHFLRKLDTEATSELRYDKIPLRQGGEAAFGSSPDIDEIDLASVLHFRTLVTRRSPTASRPPSVYSPVWEGKSYIVWQRPEPAPPVLEHLSLGSRYQPAAVPRCTEVERLARVAAARGALLATVERPPVVIVNADDSIGAPTSFGAYGEDDKVVYLEKAATFALPFAVPTAGVYEVWVGGSFASTLSSSIDGRATGRETDESTWPGMFTKFGAVPLSAGSHVLGLHYAGPDLAPGSAAVEFGLGPFVIAPAATELPITYVAPADARSICGKSLDWIEVVQPQAG